MLQPTAGWLRSTRRKLDTELNGGNPHVAGFPLSQKKRMPLSTTNTDRVSCGLGAPCLVYKEWVPPLSDFTLARWIEGTRKFWMSAPSRDGGTGDVVEQI